MRALLVEDDGTTRLRMHRTLQRQDLDVVACEDAEHALELQIEEPFGLIVLDMMLPGMDGAEFATRVRQLPNGDRPYILVTTSLSAPEDLVRILDSGVNDYIAKPVELDLLRVRLMIARRYIAEIEARHSLEALNAALEVDRLASIGMLAAGIAHEINTPAQFVNDNLTFIQDAFADIAPVMKAVEALFDKATPPSTEALSELEPLVEEAGFSFLESEIPSSLSQARDGVSRIREIVGAMKTFASPETGSSQTVDINAQIRSVVIVSANRWQDTATIEADLAEDLGLIPCHPGPLGQVILNMIINSVDAIETARVSDSDLEGQIRIATRLREDHVEITVEDNGCGISQEACQRVFDPFFTTKEVGSGTGQGLSYAHNVIAGQHGGSIKVDTESEGLTRFIICLPRQAF